MTVEETKDYLKKFGDIHELSEKIENVEDFLKNCDESKINVEVRFSPKHFTFRPVWEKENYGEELRKICLAMLKINLERELEEMKEKLSKVDIKIETKD